MGLFSMTAWDGAIYNMQVQKTRPGKMIDETMSL